MTQNQMHFSSWQLKKGWNSCMIGKIASYTWPLFVQLIESRKCFWLTKTWRTAWHVCGALWWGTPPPPPPCTPHTPAQTPPGSPASRIFCWKMHWSQSWWKPGIIRIIFSCLADVEIMVQPSSLAARNFSRSQKFLKKYSAVCQIYLKKVVINPIFYYFLWTYVR